MRHPIVVIVSFALFACNKSAPPAATAAPQQTAPTASAGIRGKVLEKIDAGQYSYLKLQTAEGETWTAVPKTDKEVGAQVVVANAVWMQNFKSNTMGRTWERIAFGTLDEGAPAAAPSGAPPQGHAAAATDSPQGMFAQAASPQGSAASPHGLAPQHPTPSAAADLGKIKVAKAAGKSGHTVEEIWSKRATLKGQKVAVRGKVVKATNGVMGKNWLHLRDGTGEGASADLTVASDDTAALGDTVLVTGVVHTDKDLGAGYHYDVIVEDARIKAE
ncbi:MAG: nucleotide-binding protein [Myxococcales bacterium]